MKKRKKKNKLKVQTFFSKVIVLPTLYESASSSIFSPLEMTNLLKFYPF